MNYRHFKYEGWFYALAFLLAIALRFIRLGGMPLNDSEASLALQALQLASGLKPVILQPHPAYILFTTPFFFLYGGGMNGLARLVPAVVGSMLVFAPLLFQDRLKPRPSLILAFFIALDPGLVAISRQAGSPILAITFILFAFGFFRKNNFRWAGIFAALALLSGPAIWGGILALAISLAIYQAARLLLTRQDEASFQMDAASRNEFLISLAVTLLVAGTLFFLIPNGLSAALASMPAYLTGWRSVVTMKSIWMLISLLAYQPFGILLAVMAIVRGWFNPSHRIIPLSIWFVVSLLLALVYPARQITDLAWALVPLYAMAALELARFVNVAREERLEAVGAVVLTAFLWVFGWLNFISMVWSAPGDAAFNQHLILVIGSIVLLILSIVLVAFGWSMRVAQVGLIWGLGITLSILSLSGTLGVTGLHGMFSPELWWPQGVPLQADLLISTIDDLSEWDKGHDDAIPVVIVGIDSPALEWALREHSPKVANFFDASQPPSLIVSAFGLDPNTIAAYRGQDFIWRFNTAWEVAQPRDWLKWVAYREMTQNSENTILWASNDLFINAKP